MILLQGDVFFSGQILSDFDLEFALSTYKPKKG